MLQTIVTQGWRRLTQAALGLGIAALMSACGGGGGGAGTPVVGPGSGASSPTGVTPSPTAADLVVVLSKTTITNSGADTLTATVTSVNSNRVAVGGVPVTFSADADAVVTPAGTATDAASGTLTATLSQGSNSTPRPVTLTVTAGTVSRAVTFNVVQNSSPTNPQADDLTLTLSSTNIDNSGSRTVIATATAVDGNRNALEGIPVLLSVVDPNSSAFVIAPSTQTNTSGQVAGTVSIGQDRSNRTITVRATSGKKEKTAAFEITGTQFAQATAVPSVVAPGAVGAVQYRLTDVNGNAMASVPIMVTGNGVIAKESTTNLNGGYNFEYTAPTAPGTTLSLTARAGGVISLVTVPISGGSSNVPNAAAPAAKALNLSADVVSVNVENTNNQISLNAFFRDQNNAPVPNVRVLFGVSGDNGTGAVSSGANTVLSDASGTASANYRPGAVSSPTNGVSIRACWKTTDFTAAETVANCPASQLLVTTLTIVSSPVSISIGTSNTLAIGSSGLTYVKRFVVLVVDSAGNPKSDVQITPSVDLGGFGKGYFTYDVAAQKWVQTQLAICPNEDHNRNGVIDTNEDANANKQLDPRKSEVAIALSGSTKTDANGVAVLQLEYPQNVASWVKFKITVTAAGVLSPPAYYPLGVAVALPSMSVDALDTIGISASNYLYTYESLPVLADALSSEADPPFVRSSYGWRDGNCKSAQ